MPYAAKTLEIGKTALGLPPFNIHDYKQGIDIRHNHPG